MCSRAPPFTLKGAFHFCGVTSLSRPFTRSFTHSLAHVSTADASASTSVPPTFLRAPSCGASPAATTDSSPEQKTSARNSLPAAGAEPRPRPGARARRTPVARRCGWVGGVAVVRLGALARRLSYLGNSGRGGPDVTGGAPPHCGTGLAGQCASPAFELAELLPPLPRRREPLRAAGLSLLSVSIPRARCGGGSGLPAPRGAARGLPKETVGCSRAAPPFPLALLWSRLSSPVP